MQRAKVPVAIVVVAFHSSEAAGQVADAVKEAKHQGQLSYKNLAVIRKDVEGKVKIKETGDMGSGVGAEEGAAVVDAYATAQGERPEEEPAEE